MRDLHDRLSELELRLEQLSKSHSLLRHRFEYAAIQNAGELAGGDPVEGSGIHWIKQTDTGWIRTQDRVGNVRSLPSYLKIYVTSEVGERIQFRIEEGVLRGQTGSIPSSASEYLTTTSPLGQGDVDLYLKPVDGPPQTIDGVTYEREFTIRYDGGTSGPFLASVGEFPLPHRAQPTLEIPDFPHDSDPGYGPFRTVWFRIGDSGDKYLHAGAASLEGCVGVLPADWPAVYKTLIRHRRSDHRSVGILWNSNR